MNCPYCNEEIDDKSIECPICGEKITIISKIQNNIKSFILSNKNKLLSVISTIVVLVVAIILCLTAYKIIDNTIHNPNYKSVVSYEQIAQTEVPATGADIIKLLNQQETDLMEILKGKHLQARKNAVFTTYYNNLRHYAPLLEGQNSYDNYDEERSISQWNPKLAAGNYAIINGVKYKPIIKSDEYGSVRIREIHIVNPNAPYYSFLYCGEGYFKPAINIQVIVDKYAQYLGKDWQLYLNNRLIEEKVLNKQSFFIECYLNVGKKDLMSWIIMWQDFLKKYPNYELNNEIRTSLKLYSLQFIRTSQIDIDWNTQKLTNETRKMYEDYLEKVDNNTEEYKLVKENYDGFKERNWKEKEYNYEETNETEQYAKEEDAYVGGDKVSINTHC